MDRPSAMAVPTWPRGLGASAQYLWLCRWVFQTLSGIGHVLIRGHLVPIAGRICMDQFMVDLTSFPDIQEGDEAILFGEGLSVDELARLIGTINYEMVCMVSKRVPRIIK